MNYESAQSKAEAVARMYFLGNRVVEPLGPGSKEKKSALVALGQFVGLDLSEVAGKHECGRLVAERTGVQWDDSCRSAGDTVTLTGLNRLVDGSVNWYVQSGRRPVRSLMRDLVSLNPAPRWDDNPEDAQMPEDLTEVEQNITAAIAELSAEGPTPTGIEVPRSYDYDLTELSLSDGTWRTPLAAVQGWLHLPDQIDESSAAAFDRSVGRMLDLPVSGEPGLEYFNRLHERLERATSLRQQFLDELENESEGTATLETASATWAAAWGDVEENEEAETSGPISANADTWPISQFRQYAVDGEMDLNPSYQRADVWPTADAQLLIESVLRGIPLPSVILLQQDTDQGDRYEIVDGKQRLTSILRFTAAHPRALATVAERAEAWGVSADDTVELFQKDYPAFKKLWRKNEARTLTAKAEKELYFPFALRSGNVPTLSGDLEQVRGHYYSEIRHIAIQVGKAKKRIRSLFEEVSDYRIPVIVYHQATSRQIHEVFSLYNKQGKHLNAEEIRNAAFHELDFMRALLATSGDTDGVERVAPFLTPVWSDLSSTGRVLADANGPYGLPDAGYKRSKALSWVAAALLLEDENLAARSTAAHINNLLKRIQDDRRDPLRDQGRVISAMVLLDKAVDAHQAMPPEAWAPSFRNAQLRGRWQELQLVASLITLAGAYAVRGDELEDLLDDEADEIAKASAGWVRPPKTQSRQQWEYIGGVVRGFLELLEVDPAAADDAIRSRLGSSGIRNLVALPHPHWWK